MLGFLVYPCASRSPDSERLFIQEIDSDFFQDAHRSLMYLTYLILRQHFQRRMWVT
jgi:hypothetical protein